MSVQLRVSSFNIRNGRALDGRNSWPLRRRVTAAVIKAIGADVIGLQEAFGFQLSWLTKQLDVYDACGEGRDNGRRGERSPVLADRRRLELGACRTRWYGPAPDRPGSRLAGAGHPRVATIADVAVPSTGDRFQVANTHLDEANADNRLRSVEQLLVWVDTEGPLIVMGDLNATPDDDAVAVLERAGLRSVLPAEAGGTNHDFTGRRDGRRLDHIFVSHHWEVESAHIDTGTPGRGRVLASDHWPVVADLRLG